LSKTDTGQQSISSIQKCKLLNEAIEMSLLQIGRLSFTSQYVPSPGSPLPFSVLS